MDTSVLSLSEDLTYYIDNCFIEDRKPALYEAFALMKVFGDEFFEDELLDIIRRDDSLDSNAKYDSFNNIVKNKLIGIIYSHGITIAEEQPVTLNELNEIVQCLYTIQNLETVSYIKYLVFTESSSEAILGDLIEYLTLMSSFRFLELVEAVESSLIDSIRLLIQDKEKEDNEDTSHRKNVLSFFKFIEDADCLGIRYYNSGYINLHLDRLLNLLPIDVPSYIDKEFKISKAQAALDVLSLLMISKDAYEFPLLAFKKNPLLFTNSLENGTTILNIIEAMLADYTLFLEAEKQREVVSD
jgi:hypothetical protein